MGEREASGDFDYLWDDPADADGLTSDDVALEVQPAWVLDPPRDAPDDDLWDEPGDNFWDNQPDPDENGHFDAFKVDTWSFTPAPTPWYRTKQALTAIIAASAAVAAIVVSGVLLVFRGPAGTVDEVTSSVTPTAPTSAQPAPAATSAAPEPPEPPLPPPATTATAGDGLTRRHGADIQPDVPTAADQGAGDRRDAHPRDPGTDQRRAAAAHWA